MDHLESRFPELVCQNTPVTDHRISFEAHHGGTSGHHIFLEQVELIALRLQIRGVFRHESIDGIPVLESISHSCR